MKKETGILLAGSIGLLIGIGLFGFNRFCRKCNEAYDEYYSDFHRHFVNIPKDEADEGIEFLAVK